MENLSILDLEANGILIGVSLIHDELRTNDSNLSRDKRYFHGLSDISLQYGSSGPLIKGKSFHTYKDNLTYSDRLYLCLCTKPSGRCGLSQVSL